MDEIERDIDVLANGWLAAVCLIAGLVAAFLFATWAVSCTAHAFLPPLWTPIGWHAKFPPPRPEGWVEPSSPELTTAAAIEGLEESASTGDSVDIQWNATATVIPGDGHVLMYNGTTLKWTTPPQGTTKAKKGGIMGLYVSVSQLHWVFLGTIGILFAISFGVYGIIKWLTDGDFIWEDAENFAKDEDDGTVMPMYQVCGLCFLAVILGSTVLAWAWPLLYPAAAIVGALYGTRALIRLKKAVKGKADADHTHKE